MHKKIIILPFLMSIVGVIFLAHYVIGLAKESSIPPLKGNYLSPLPNNLTNLVKGIINPQEKINLEPFPTNSPLATEDAKLTAESALSVDLTTNKIIYAKNIYERRPIASTIKIMTAILALENGNLDDEITISHSAAEVGEDVMATSPGEKYTLRQLMYGMFLLSANDAAEAISESIFSRREVFIARMNSKAEELGLKDTKFVNPSGLDGDGEHYSTAKDLFQMSRYAMKIPEFREIAKTKEYLIEETKDHKGQYMTNQTNLLTTYPGVEGIKTGYTPAAGLCLATYAKNSGHEIIAIVLNSASRRDDMKKLLDLSYKTLGVEIPKHD